MDNEQRICIKEDLDYCASRSTESRQIGKFVSVIISMEIALTIAGRTSAV